MCGGYLVVSNRSSQPSGKDEGTGQAKFDCWGPVREYASRWNASTSDRQIGKLEVEEHRKQEVWRQSL